MPNEEADCKQGDLAMNEEQLVKQIEEHLLEGSLKTFREFPLLHRRVDLIGFRKSDNYVIMVEAKMSNWIRAVEQARVCVLVADDVYIAVPETIAHRVDTSELKRFGIGLMVLNGSVKIQIQSTSKLLNNEYLKERFIENLEKISSVTTPKAKKVTNGRIYSSPHS